MQLIIKNGKVIATHYDFQAISASYPDCEVVHYDGNLPAFDGLTGLPDDPRTTEEKQLSYQDKRRQAYPTVEEQLDMLYWDEINKTKIWVDAISAIKAEFPKPIKIEI